MGETEIAVSTQQLNEPFKTAFDSDGKTTLALNVCMKNDTFEVCMQRSVSETTDHVFTHKVQSVPNLHASLHTAQQEAGNIPFTVGASVPNADPEKRRKIQRQLALLLHASRCQSQGSQTVGEVQLCAVPYCHTMLNVLNHMTICQAGKSCEVPQCASSQLILSHWKNCMRSDCRICSPLKQAPHCGQQQIAAPVQQAQPSQGPGPVDMQRAYVTLGLQTNGDLDTNVNQVMQKYQDAGIPQLNDVQPTQCPMQSLNHIQARQLQPQPLQQLQIPLRPMGLGAEAVTRPGQQNLTLGADSPLNCAQLRDGVQNVLPGASSHVFPVVQGIVLRSPSTKDWHQNITQGLRHSLIQKIIQALLLPTTDPNILQDQRMINLAVYAAKIEGDMYEMANCRDEYYQLLAEKMYKVKKDLEEKRQRRLMQWQAEQIH